MEQEKQDKKKKEHEIEIRSEAVQEVMGMVPPWILRWGITLLFIIILTLLVGSFFFKYPDVIVAEMILTGKDPVAQVVGRTSGKINKLYVADGQEVHSGDWLAVIENPAETEDVVRLKNGLSSLSSKGEIMFNVSKATSFLNSSFLNEQEDTVLLLGDIQPFYTSYLSALHEYQIFYALNYYTKKIAVINENIRKYKLYKQNQERQQRLLEAQFGIAGSQDEQDSSLFIKGAILASEHVMAHSAMLQSQYSLKSGYTAFGNIDIQLSRLETNLLEIKLQQAEKNAEINQNYRTRTEELWNAINNWKFTYCLSAPIDGKVTLNKYWDENQIVTLGDSIFTIIPDEKGQLQGKALLPIERSGKVKIGQRVIIRFHNFPDQEFGIVNGIVKRISLVPLGNFYHVEIDFPDGLRTNYGKTLPVSLGMKASAEIVTEDIRLIERFFMPLKKVYKENF